MQNGRINHSGGRHDDVDPSDDDLPSGRVPGRASELPRSEIDDDGRDGTFRGIWSFKQVNKE